MGLRHPVMMSTAFFLDVFEKSPKPDPKEVGK